MFERNLRHSTSHCKLQIASILLRWVYYRNSFYGFLRMGLARSDSTIEDFVGVETGMYERLLDTRLCD